MNNNLTKQQTTAIAKVVGMTLLGVAVIFLFGIGFFQKRTSAIQLKIMGVQTEIHVAENTGQKMASFQRDLDIGKEKLAEEEKAITQGDPLRWIRNRFSPLENRYQLTGVVLERPIIQEWVRPPKVETYQLAFFSISGHAYYHDFSSLIADLENTMPFSRILHISLNAVGEGYSDLEAAEKLRFEIGFVNPYKPFY